MRFVRTGLGPNGAIALGSPGIYRPLLRTALEAAMASSSRTPFSLTPREPQRERIPFHPSAYSARLDQTYRKRGEYHTKRLGHDKVTDLVNQHDETENKNGRDAAVNPVSHLNISRTK